MKREVPGDWAAHHPGILRSTDEVPTRQRILQTALSLMSRHGMDGTSMRDLASACNLNVATLYHHFGSKRELLEAVLLENGLYPVKARNPTSDDESEDGLAVLVANILKSMFQVEDFVRLMIGEAIRLDETARTVGGDLFASFRDVLEAWIRSIRPDLDQRSGAAPVARLLTDVVVGTFVQHASGVVDLGHDDLDLAIWKRSREVAQMLLGPR